MIAQNRSPLLIMKWLFLMDGHFIRSHLSLSNQMCIPLLTNPTHTHSTRQFVSKVNMPDKQLPDPYVATISSFTPMWDHQVYSLPTSNVTHDSKHLFFCVVATNTCKGLTRVSLVSQPKRRLVSHQIVTTPFVWCRDLHLGEHQPNLSQSQNFARNMGKQNVMNGSRTSIAVKTLVNFGLSPLFQ